MRTETRSVTCPICQQSGTAVYLENEDENGRTGQMRLQSLDCPAGCWKSPGALALLSQLIEAPVASANFTGHSLTFGDLVASKVREGVYSVKWRTGQKMGTITEENGAFHAVHGQTGDAGTFATLVDAVDGLAEAD